MKLRKKMLMMVLACLVGFQPTIKADDTIAYKAILVLAVLYNIRPISKVLGEIFLKVGYFLGGTRQTVREVIEVPIKAEETQKKPDSVALSNAKSLFNKNFTKFKAEENVEYTYNVYNKLPALGSTSEISSLYTLKDKQTLVSFLEEREKKAKLPIGASDLLGSSYYMMQYPHNFDGEIRKKMDMTEREYEHIYKPTVKGLRLGEDDFSELVTHMNQQIADYHKYKNNKIVTLCSAHTACEQGTAKQVKKIASNRNASEIVCLFHLAVKSQQSVNEIKSEEMETSAGAVLACFGQKAQ